MTTTIGAMQAGYAETWCKRRLKSAAGSDVARCTELASYRYSTMFLNYPDFTMRSFTKKHCPKVRRFLAPAVLMVLGLVNATDCAAAEQVSSITNLLQLSRLPDSEPILVDSLNLEGTVWWSSEAQGTLILQDASSVAQLELNLPCPIPSRGDHLRLTGKCSLVKTREVIKLSAIPVVDNYGLHAMIEKSGSIYLQAGRHPIRVTWFNRTDKFGLEVEYAGPDLPRQRIPDAVLFRFQSSSTNEAANLVNGLDYRCCEGLWWSLLPNLSHLPAVKTGVVGNFDLSVKTRDEHVGLQFSGYLQITNEGRYTFYTKSDDGSRLFIGDSTLLVNVIGENALPQLSQVANKSITTESDDYEWSEIVGTVTSVNRLDGDLEIELTTDSGRVLIKVAENSDCSFALVPQNRIRAVGVRHNILRLDGTKVPAEIFVQSWSDIEQRFVAPDLWTTYPLLSISNALAASFSKHAQPIVHFCGKISQTAIGQPIFLEDASGRIALETSGSNYPSAGTLELLGRLSIAGTNWVLRCGFSRRLGEIANEPGTPPVLTTAEQVHLMNPEALKQGYPVKLSGVITAVLQGDAVVIQDTTRGIYLAIGKPLPLQVGDYCAVEGVAQPGQFSPYIAASKVKRIGSGALPNPVLPTWDQLINGNLHAQYVELKGVATLIESNTVTLLTRDGRIRVQLDAMAPPIPQSYVNAIIRLRGCLFANWDTQLQQVKVGDIRLNHQWVDVVQPAPVNLFAIPAKRIGELLKFDPQAGAFQRVKVSGQIIHQGEGGNFLMDGENGLRFVCAGNPTAHVCDLVEVVGFPDLSGPAPVLREAVVQRSGMAKLPKPRQLKADNLLRDEYDSTLVQMDGALLAVNNTPDGFVLEMQNGLHRFIATVNDKAGLDVNLAPGSQLELTGVYVGQGGNRVLGQPIDSFRLLLNTGFDIRVLSRPPWWTLRRLLTMAGMLAGVLMAALIWIKQLHQTVNQRSRQLEAQIQQRQQAERLRELEHERARVAQDLHDDLGAGLTRINMLTSLAGSPATTGEAKTQYLADLKTMARDMVSSLDEIVWAMNPRNDTVTSLVGYFGAHAQGLLSLASVKCGLDVAEELPDFPLDSKFRHEILMAFKEAITNIIRHSGATRAGLKIRVENGVLILEVTDNGCGFNPNQLSAGADGLLNMKVRMSDLGGGCKIQSELGKGTTIRFEVPLSKSATTL